MTKEYDLEVGKTYKIQHHRLGAIAGVYTGVVNYDNEERRLFECIDEDGDTCAFSVMAADIMSLADNQLRTHKDHKKTYEVGETYEVSGKVAVYIGKSHLHEEYPHYFENDEKLYFIPESACDADVKRLTHKGGMSPVMAMAMAYGKPTVAQIFALYEKLSTKDKTRFGIMALEDSMKD